MRLARRCWTSSIGVDVGHDAVKLMQLKDSNGALSVLAAAKERFPAEIRQDKRWSYRRYRYTVDALRGLLRRGGFQGQWANLAIGGEALAMGSIRLKLDECGEQEIVAAAREHLGLSREASVSYLAAGPVREDMGCRESFLTFGAGERELSDLLAMLEEAGLKCRSIEPDVCAIQECFSKTPDGCFQIVVDMGQQTTNMALSHSGHLAWAKQIPMGGGQLTERVAAKLDLDWEHAEALRWQCDRSENGQVERMLMDLTQNLAQELAHQIQEALCLGNSVIPVADGGEVIFTGGEAHGPVPKLLQERISQPVKVGRPLAWLDPTDWPKRACPLEPQGEWSVALGLCLLERDQEREKIPA
jgi:Tfp pilus assembly PilM family ATPase